MATVREKTSRAFSRIEHGAEGRHEDGEKRRRGEKSVGRFVSGQLSVAERIKGRAKMIVDLGFKSKETGGQCTLRNYHLLSGILLKCYGYRHL
jgi:hypothetical protein